MKKSYTIGVLIGNANSPYSMDLMQGIYHAAEKRNVSLLFFLGIHNAQLYEYYFGGEAEDNYDYQSDIVYDYALFGKLDALIISYGTMCLFLGQEDKASFLNKFSGIPYVLLEARDETGRGSSIISDNYAGMYEVAEHLVRDHGCRRILYLSGPRGNTDAWERRAAVIDAMKKYGVPFDESHIEYGDFSSCVEAEVNLLLDRYPHADALICGNDQMADTAYKECGKRGLTVGRDIAVTGYDDWEIAKSLTPPLTTVHQDVQDMGFAAVDSALALCRGEKPSSTVTPAQVKYRRSCGCSAVPDDLIVATESERCLDWETYRQLAVNYCMEKSLLSNLSVDIQTAAGWYIRAVLQKDFREKKNHEQILLQLKRLLNSGMDQYLSLLSFLQALSACIDVWIRWQDSHPQQKICDCMEMIDLKEQIQEAITIHIIKTDTEHYSKYEQETWFLPLISRDMMNHIDSEKEFYHAALEKLSALEAKQSYLYLFREPIRHVNGAPWDCPMEMYLAASQQGRQVTAYEEEERPLLTRAGGFPQYCRDGRFSMIVYCLYSGEMQYGILVTEISPANFALSHLISMHISNALKYHELSKEQRRTQQALEQSVREVRKKNEVLSFISEYDDLTGILNRRGFMEQAQRLNSAHTGETAVMVLADLDHLKEINDRFGHMEGDVALKRCAKSLQDALQGRGIAARIGGDEFVLLLLGCTQDGRELLSEVKKANEAYNRTSGKDYLVEVSMGCQEFVCGEQVVMTELFRAADSRLYEAKKQRRTSVRR